MMNIEHENMLNKNNDHDNINNSNTLNFKNKSKNNVVTKDIKGLPNIEYKITWA